MIPSSIEDEQLYDVVVSMSLGQCPLDVRHENCNTLVTMVYRLNAERGLF